MKATYDKNDLKSVLGAIRDELGKPIFRDAVRMYGVICDFAPGLSAEAEVLRKLSEKGMLSELEQAADSQNQLNIDRARMKIRYQLTRKMFINEEKAAFFVDALESLYRLEPTPPPPQPKPPTKVKAETCTAHTDADVQTATTDTHAQTATYTTLTPVQPNPTPYLFTPQSYLLMLLFSSILVFGILLFTLRGGYTGDVTWNLNCFTGVLVISGNGCMDDYDYTNHRSPWKGSKRVTSVIIEEGVTYIGTASFSYCENMTNVTVPNSVTGIGSKAFIGCDSLSEIKIPDGVTIIQPATFASSGLQNIIIPENVQVIGKEAFYFCPLGNAVIPDSVVRIDSKAFAATNLESVSIPANAKVAKQAFPSTTEVTRRET